MIRCFFSALTLLLCGLIHNGYAQTVNSTVATTAVEPLRFHGTWRANTEPMIQYPLVEQKEYSKLALLKGNMKKKDTPNEEMVLPLNPQDTVICFEPDGTFWVNQRENRGRYTLSTEVDPQVKDYLYRFEVRIKGEAYELALHKGQMTVIKKQEDREWYRRYTRKKTQK